MYSAMQMNSQADLRTTVFVGNVAVFCSEAEINQLFSSCGEVLEIRLAKSDDFSKHLSYGFVKFSTVTGAQLAMQRLNGAVLCGRTLKVDKALSRNSKENTPKAPQAFDSASVHLTFMTNSVSMLITEETIRSLCASFGPVVDVIISKHSTDPVTGKQSGYGFVHFPLTSEGVDAAFRAAEMLADVIIDQVNYRCKISHDLEQQLRRMSRQSGYGHSQSYSTPPPTPTLIHNLPASLGMFGGNRGAGYGGGAGFGLGGMGGSMGNVLGNMNNGSMNGMGGMNNGSMNGMGGMGNGMMNGLGGMNGFGASYSPPPFTPSLGSEFDDLTLGEGKGGVRAHRTQSNSSLGSFTSSSTPTLTPPFTSPNTSYYIPSTQSAVPLPPNPFDSYHFPTAYPPSHLPQAHHAGLKQPQQTASGSYASWSHARPTPSPSLSLFNMGELRGALDGDGSASDSSPLFSVRDLLGPLPPPASTTPPLALAPLANPSQVPGATESRWSTVEGFSKLSLSSPDMLLTSAASTSTTASISPVTASVSYLHPEGDALFLPPGLGGETRDELVL